MGKYLSDKDMKKFKEIYPEYSDKEIIEKVKTRANESKKYPKTYDESGFFLILFYSLFIIFSIINISISILINKGIIEFFIAEAWFLVMSSVGAGALTITLKW